MEIPVNEIQIIPGSHVIMRIEKLPEIIAVAVRRTAPLEKLVRMRTGRIRELFRCHHADMFAVSTANDSAISRFRQQYQFEGLSVIIHIPCASEKISAPKSFSGFSDVTEA